MSGMAEGWRLRFFSSFLRRNLQGDLSGVSPGGIVRRSKSRRDRQEDLPEGGFARRLKGVFRRKNGIKENMQIMRNVCGREMSVSSADSRFRSAFWSMSFSFSLSGPFLGAKFQLFNSMISLFLKTNSIPRAYANKDLNQRTR